MSCLSNSPPIGERKADKAARNSLFNRENAYLTHQMRYLTVKCEEMSAVRLKPWNIAFARFSDSVIIMSLYQCCLNDFYDRETVIARCDKTKRRKTAINSGDRAVLMPVPLLRPVLPAKLTAQCVKDYAKNGVSPLGRVSRFVRGRLRLLWHLLRMLKWNANP